ncbi:mannose-ethanolamine phosphotransferase gpi13, partial [Ascosphaera pollenicola]
NEIVLHTEREAAANLDLDESAGWATDVDGVKTALQDARREKGTDVRAIAVINPGNPTGSCLSFEAIRGVLEIAAKEKLVVIADEVYQTNIFAAQPHPQSDGLGTAAGFISFKKVLRTMQQRDPTGLYSSVELVSLNSVSKGMVGECGHRGGYFELIGFHPAVRDQIYKFISVGLCPPVIGQCLVDLMVNPPKKGDPSYPLYSQEYNHIKNQMHQRAMALYKAFMQMEGVSCALPTGSMYLYPRLSLPLKAVQAAKRAGLQPDEYYCGRLLDATGICVVPGSGFGQVEGTFHLRTTFLAPGTEWVGRIVDFHKRFMEEFR